MRRARPDPRGLLPSMDTGGRSSLLSALAANAAAGTLFSWSVLLPALSARLGRPAVELGAVFSTSLVAFAIAVLCSGATVDRHGPRRATALAGMLSGAGLVLGAYAPNVLFLHLGIGVLFGFGSGLTYLATVSWATTRAGPRRTWAVGVVVASYAAGPMVAAPLAGLGADQWGTQTTLSIAALTVGGVMLLASRGLPGPLDPPQSSGGGEAARVGDVAALIALWFFSLGAFAPGLLGFAFAATIATHQGMSPRGAGVLLALMATANLLGRLCAAPLRIRIGLGAALVADLGALTLALVTLAWVPGALATVVGLLLIGIQYGMTSALLPLSTQAVSGAARFATAYGRVFSSWGVAALLGPATGAALYDVTDGFSRGFEASLVGTAVAAIALVVYHHRCHRPGSAAQPRP